MICASYRQWGLSTLLAFSIVFAAIHFDTRYELQACELCSLARDCFILAGLGFYLLTFQALQGSKDMLRKITQLSTLIISIAGFVISTRQAYLQYFSPPLHNSCAPSLSYLLDNFSLAETFQKLWAGGAGCQMIDFTVLGLSLAGFASLFFGLLSISSLFGRCCQPHRTK